MILFIFIRTFPFNENFNGLFQNMYNDSIAKIEASGSRYCWDFDLKDDVLTKPENAIDPNAKHEWCSNFNRSKSDKPWISFDFKEISFRISGYSLKAGCCGDTNCCCKIYSWSMQGSNDNKTWASLHSVEKDDDFFKCKEKSFKISESGNYRFYRMIQDESQPNCWYCMDISRIELYGDLNTDQYNNIMIDSEEEVSIIGKVTH